MKSRLVILGNGLILTAICMLLTGLYPALGLAEDLIRIPFTVYGFDAGQPFASPRGLFCDLTLGEILVAEAGAHRIVIFDSGGWPKYEFTHWVERGGKMTPGEPAAVAAVPNGNIFIIDVLSLDLHIVDFRGQPLYRISPAELLPGQEDPRLATCLALGPKGHVFAVIKSLVGHHLIELDETGKILDRVPLGQPGELVQVTGIAVSEDRIHVSDLAAESCVQVFDREGRRELAFGIHDTGWGNFSFPAAIAVTSEGHMWVADQIRQIVNHFDPDGKFIDFIGGQGFGPGSMSYPCAVAVDGTDRIMVLEKAGRRFQVFVLPEGRDAARPSGA
jgi:hypothetical protein